VAAGGGDSKRRGEQTYECLTGREGTGRRTITKQNKMTERIVSVRAVEVRHLICIEKLPQLAPTDVMCICIQICV